jgi:hypothetical protein
MARMSAARVPGGAFPARMGSTERTAGSPERTEIARELAHSGVWM